MTPGQLYTEYRNLSVDLLDGRVLRGIDVHEYRNNALGGEFSTVHGLKAYDELVNEVKKHCKPIGSGKYQFFRKESHNGYAVTYSQTITTWPDLQRPYIGKGTPHDIRMALRLAVHFGLLPAVVSAIQSYCNSNIGLDCSGFAGAYYGGEWMGKGATYFRDNAKKVTRLEDVRSGDAIVFQSGVHIALIDSITSAERESGIVYAVGCKVAESTADRMVVGGPSDGLNYTDYYLLLDDSGFKVMRSFVYNGNDSYDSPNIFVMGVS